MLLVYSIINKTYILDLLPGFSFVEHLLDEGLDVYMVEWGETEPRDRTTGAEAASAECLSDLVGSDDYRHVSIEGSYECGGRGS